MIISFKYKGILIQLHYHSVDGHFLYAVNQLTGKKMMRETYDEDDGYRFIEKTWPVKTMTCNVDCVRIIELDIFVPKFIFIKNK
jgi:hypothetical protein